MTRLEVNQYNKLKMCLFSGSVLLFFLTAKMESWIDLTQDEAASSGSTSGNSVANMVSSS